MSERCFDLQELLEIAERPAGDPAWRHVEACPRCRNRLALYREFRATPAVLPGTHPEEARARLEAALAGWMKETGPATPGPARRREWPARSGRGLARLGRLFTPPFPRAAWATAVVLVAAGAYLTLRLLPLGGGEPIVLRERPAARPARVAFEIEPARYLPGAMLELRWHSVPGAEEYMVRILAADLAPLDSLPPTRDTVLSLPMASLPGGAAPGAVLAWRVEARRGGGMIAESRVGTIRLP